MPTNKTIQLFPRGDFKERVDSLCSGTIANYIEVLLDVKNRTELELFEEHANLKELIERRLNGEDDGLKNLDELWDIWAEMTSELPYVVFEYETARKMHEIECTPPTAFKNEVSQAIKEFVSSINERSEFQSQVRNLGYKHLPTWPTVIFSGALPEIVSDIGFDPFKEFDDYAERIDLILPKKNLELQYANPYDGVKVRLIEEILYVAREFSQEWERCKNEIAKRFETTRSEDGQEYALNGVAFIGRAFVLANLYTQMLLIDPNLIRDYKEQIAECIKHLKVQKGPKGQSEYSKNESVNELLGYVGEAIDGLKSLGVDDEVAKTLPFNQLLLSLCLLFGDKEMMADLADDSRRYDYICYFAPFLTSGTRQAFADRIVEDASEDDELIPDWLDKLAFAHQPFLAKGNDTQKICAIFNRLNFRRKPIERRTFLELSGLYFSRDYPDQDDLLADEIGREFFIQSQKIIGWYYDTPRASAPYALQSLDRLRYYGCIGRFRDYRVVEVNVIWALSRILHDEEDFMDERRADFAKQCLSVSALMLQRGLLSGATCLFNFLLVSESIRLVAEHSYENSELSDFNYMQPFGDWPTFNFIVTNLLNSSQGRKVEMALKYALTYLSESEIEKLGLVISELQAYLGATTTSSVNHHNAAEIIKLVHNKQGSIRERLMSLMGEETWNGLPQRIRGQIVQCEQIYDQSMGDEVLSGDPNYSWLTSYVTTVEKLFKIKMGGLWSDLSLDKDLSAAYTAGTRKAGAVPRFGLGAALYVCIGATESGNATILNELKRVGVDAHELVAKVSKDLLKLIKVRNKVTHAEEVKREDADDSRRILLLRLPALVKLLGIKDGDF